MAYTLQPVDVTEPVAPTYNVVLESTYENFDGGKLLYPFRAGVVEGDPGSEGGLFPELSTETAVFPRFLGERLRRDNVPEPYIFEVYNERNGRWTHVAVAAFHTLPEDTLAQFPMRVLAQIDAQPGARVLVRYVQLPLARGITLAFAEVPEDEPGFVQVFRRAARKRVAVTTGDAFFLRADDGREYRVQVTQVAPNIVQGVSVVRGFGREREFAYTVYIDSRNQERPGKRAKSKRLLSTQVLRFAPPQDDTTLTGVNLENGGGVPLRSVWFMDWNIPGGLDALAINPGSEFARSAAKNVDCDICANPLLGEPDEGLQFFPRTQGDPLYPLCALAYHSRNFYLGKIPRTGDTRRDEIAFPEPLSLDVRHLECMLAYLTRAFASTESDFVYPEAAKKIPRIVWFLGRKARETLDWSKVPEIWLWPVLLQQTITFSMVQYTGDTKNDRAPVTLVKPFFDVLASLSVAATDPVVRESTRTMYDALLGSVQDMYSASKRVVTLRKQVIRSGVQLYDEYGPFFYVQQEAEYVAREDNAERMGILLENFQAQLDLQALQSVCIRYDSVACVEALDTVAGVAVTEREVNAAIAFEAENVFLFFQARYPRPCPVLYAKAAKRGAEKIIFQLQTLCPVTATQRGQIFAGAVANVQDPPPYFDRLPGEAGETPNEARNAYFATFEALLQGDTGIIAKEWRAIGEGLRKNKDNVEQGKSYNEELLLFLYKKRGLRIPFPVFSAFFDTFLGKLKRQNDAVRVLFDIAETIEAQFLEQTFARVAAQEQFPSYTLSSILRGPSFTGDVLQRTSKRLVKVVMRQKTGTPLPHLAEYLYALRRLQALDGLREVPGLALDFYTGNFFSQPEVYGKEPVEGVFVKLFATLARFLPLPALNELQRKTFTPKMRKVFE